MEDKSRYKNGCRSSMGKRISSAIIVGILMFTAFVAGEYVQKRYYVWGGKPEIVEPPEPEVQIVYKVADEGHKATDSIAAMVLKLQPKLEPVVVETISKAVSKHSAKFSLPPELVLAVISRESRFRVLVTSNKGAVGLMQVMPKAHLDKIKQLGLKGNEIYHIDHNIHLGCWILSAYYKQAKSVDKALQKYLGAKSDVYVREVLNCMATMLIDDKVAAKKLGR